jgi:hypothetical protein
MNRGSGEPLGLSRGRSTPPLAGCHAFAALRRPDWSPRTPPTATANQVSAGGKQVERQTSRPRANASIDVRSARNQRPFFLQQNLYFRPL